MRHSLITLVSVLASCAAVAAPVPTPKAFTVDWDKPVDPYKDCKFIPEKDALTIEVPGGDHDLDFKRDRRTAPRVLQTHEVEGDFVVQVRVRGTFNPSPKSSASGVPSCVTAGLLLMLPDGACIRVDFGAARRRGKQGCAYVRQIHPKGGGMFYNRFDDMNMKDWPLPVKAEQAYLKLERRGLYFRAFLSPDGEKWGPITGPFGTLGRPKFKVGLAAFSTSTEPFKVRFDQFKLTRISPKDN